MGGGIGPALLVALAGAAVSVPLASAPGGARPTPGVVDLHVDLPWQVHFRGRDRALDSGQSSLRAMLAGNVSGLVLPIYLPDGLRPGGPNLDDAEAVLATARSIPDAHPQMAPPLVPPGDAQPIRTWLSIEGAGAFAADVEAIDRFIYRGVRLVGLVHAKSNALGASATDGSAGDGGLTDLGKALARRIYDKGALVDVSHLSDASFADVAAIAREAKAPIVATHSDARALSPHLRNLTDDQLRAIAESGGVVGLNLHAPFVAAKADVSMVDVVLQLEHLVRVAGIDHVAIGSDFEGGIRAPRDMQDQSVWPRFAAALRARGMKDPAISKIFGENARRVLAWGTP